MSHTRRTTLGLFAAAIMALAPVSAFAIELDEARAKGLVGERPDGLVGSVQPNPSPDVAALVETVNRARMDSYRDVASKNKTEVSAVQAIAGGKQIEKAQASGWYVMDAGGAWRKR